MYKINEISKITGISPRMLRHYDKLDLLRPNKSRENNYRIYTDEDLCKLQEILFFKELDFSLDEIKIILENPNYDRTEAFTHQKVILLKKIERLNEIVLSLEDGINKIRKEQKMSEKNFKSFSTEEIEKYQNEVKELYGNTSTHKEYKEKTKNYKKGDFDKIQQEMNKKLESIALHMIKGFDSKEVQEALHEYREYINTNFYSCTLEIFRGLGELYVSDTRFTENINKIRNGLSEFLKKAINFYCDNNKK